MTREKLEKIIEAASELLRELLSEVLNVDEVNKEDEVEDAKDRNLCSPKNDRFWYLWLKSY